MQYNVNGTDKKYLVETKARTCDVLHNDTDRSNRPSSRVNHLDIRRTNCTKQKPISKSITCILRIFDLFETRVSKHICDLVSHLSGHRKPIRKRLSKIGDYKPIILWDLVTSADLVTEVTKSSVRLRRVSGCYLREKTVNCTVSAVGTKTPGRIVCKNNILVGLSGSDYGTAAPRRHW